MWYAVRPLVCVRDVFRGTCPYSTAQAWRQSQVVPCREGWHTLLAHALEHSRECARLLRAAPALVICSLELSVVGHSLPPARRAALCRSAVRVCASATPQSDALADAPSAASVAATGESDTGESDKQGAQGHLSFQVQWTNMSSGPPDRAGGGSVIDHGWLNVLNLSASCAETGSEAGDVVVAVALRNMLPPASHLGALCRPRCVGCYVMWHASGSLPSCLHAPSAIGFTQGSALDSENARMCDNNGELSCSTLFRGGSAG
jgi:hypothetical protein